MRRREEPSPGPPSRSCRFCTSKSYWLDVRGRRIIGYPTSTDRRDVRMDARSSDKRSSLVLFVLIIGNPHEPAMLRGLAGLRRYFLRRGWLHSYWPFPSCPVFSSRSSSLLVYWRHRATSSAGGTTPAGWSIPGASDIYTEHRSVSPICSTTTTSHQSKGYNIYIAIKLYKCIHLP